MWWQSYHQKFLTVQRYGFFLICANVFEKKVAEKKYPLLKVGEKVYGDGLFLFAIITQFVRGVTAQWGISSPSFYPIRCCHPQS